MRNTQATEAITIIPIERIERQIYLIRGQKVMLDSDLANSPRLKLVLSFKP